jgi:hypothetical protein
MVMQLYPGVDGFADKVVQLDIPPLPNK